jgi:glyoxylase-like metal-dependent hydrolase (beta-lactamase superfamily II)
MSLRIAARKVSVELENRLQERAQGSRVVLPDETFEERYTVPFGTMDIQALHLGPSHSPG